ncbi:hypothetical protein GCM10023149_32280 [Mucilaginibacter gynuensis]|uniref:Oligosaccharide repeat unit polymerase n=1 Tax=Mucilaginibacter gynuensis TaxID=1302236 RepID=A0ABP8GQ98_9SPHI
MRNVSFEKYVVLYLPWFIAWLLKDNSQTSYFIAWIGSFFIFYVSLSGKIKPLPADMPLTTQLMRPIFLAQVIFAGYMCCSSIFYYCSVLGYEDFHAPNEYYLVDNAKLMLTAQCQRYYCLGHAAFATGLLVFMQYPVQQKYYFDRSDPANFLLLTAISTLPVALLFNYIPGLSQFYYQLNSLSFIAGTLALAFAIPQQKLWNTLMCATLYAFNFYHAFVSGFKEPIIISVLVLGVFLYPTYKRVVIITFLPLLLTLFMLLPAYNRAFRQMAWTEEINVDDASKSALDATLNSQNDDDGNWTFFTYRLSEIEMFTKYVRSTPTKIDFYGTQLLRQSAQAIVPRVMWPAKPVTENLVMQRVYDAGVVYKGSNVSAKPAFIADAYLSGGGIAVFIALFLYGATAQLIALKAEKLFGGYLLGTALIFSGLFQVFWRGLSFEFLINSVFWSYITMLLLFKLFTTIGVLRRVE